MTLPKQITDKIFNEAENFANKSNSSPTYAFRRATAHIDGAAQFAIQAHKIAEALRFECDCGDNSCRFVDPKKKDGMRTNGGCRCLQNNRLGIMRHFHNSKEALKEWDEFLKKKE